MATNHASDTPETLFIGIDGGGTSCRARVVDANLNCLGEGLAGAANPYQSLEGTSAAILAATDKALSKARIDRARRASIIVGAGLAGVNLPSVLRQMNEWQHPFAEFFLTTDLEIACLGAHAGEDGAVMIAGTGSSGCSIVDGAVTIVGASGYPLADTGSGAWIGLHGLRAALLSLERLGPYTMLGKSVEASLGATGDGVVEALIDAGTDRLAQFAALVFEAAEQGDLVATEILREGASYLDGLARRLTESNPPSLSFLGGLSNSLKPWLDTNVAKTLTPPKRSAIAGACYFARREYKRLSTGIDAGA